MHVVKHGTTPSTSTVREAAHMPARDAAAVGTSWLHLARAAIANDLRSYYEISYICLMRRRTCSRPLGTLLVHLLRPLGTLVRHYMT